jgi:hypothetical protein
MDFDIQYELERPLPVLSVSLDRIAVKTQKYYEGAFSVKNAGGGVLKGHIASFVDELKFSAEEFENAAEIKFFVDVSRIPANETVKSSFAVISNGGEKKIDVLIKREPPILTTKFDVKISNLMEFYDFARQSPGEARFLFASSDFLNWLRDLEYKDMDAVSFFLSDHNKERAMDNFFLANDLKKPVKIRFASRKMSVRVSAGGEEVLPLSVKIIKEGSGYFKSSITVENGSPWLFLDSKIISSTDFVNSDYKDIDFYINSKYIKDNVSRDAISVEGISFVVEVLRDKLFSVYLDKRTFEPNDSGNLVIENNSGKDIVIEIFEQDDFIKFEGKKYIVGKSAVIPLYVKVSKGFFKKRAVFSSSIKINAYLDYKVITEEIPIFIGSII